MLQDTEFSDLDPEDLISQRSAFYNWQCVSLIRANGTSLDLIIRNDSELMCLINAVQSVVYKPADRSRLNFFKLLRVKMKLGYLSWQRHTKPRYLLKQAILKTLVEKVVLSVALI